MTQGDVETTYAAGDLVLGVRADVKGAREVMRHRLAMSDGSCHCPW